MTQNNNFLYLLALPERIDEKQNEEDVPVEISGSSGCSGDAREGRVRFGGGRISVDNRHLRCLNVFEQIPLLAEVIMKMNDYLREFT